MDEFKHHFVFFPGSWTGDGKITLNMIEEVLLFKTCWNVQEKDADGKVQCFQDIQLQGLSENMCNELLFYNFQNKTFSVEMENQNIGRILGAGVYDSQLIAWEFRNCEMNFEGFETYHLQEDGSYVMRGEYVTGDQFRTQIEARLWVQKEQTPSVGGEETREEDEEL